MCVLLKEFKKKKLVSAKAVFHKNDETDQCVQV